MKMISKEKKISSNKNNGAKFAQGVGRLYLIYL